MSATSEARRSDIAIKVDGVSKTFKLPHDKNTSIKSAVINTIGRRRGYELQQALKDISFEVKKGEFFGIVGRNGSGKSTLLKIMAGIYTPSEGTVKVNGSLAPFIELGVGFNPELTGRENVFLNGALLGFNRKQMRAMYNEIVEFAELERFMDQKLKNYSSGMQVRLAFSIAIRAKADILLLDEVLAVGDAAFQQKCNDYFANLKRDKQTIILVTHSMPAIERYCQRAMLIENSKVVKIGTSAEIAGMYEDMMVKAQGEKIQTSDGQQKPKDFDVKVVVKQNGKATKAIEALKPFEFEISIKPKKDFKRAYAGLSLRSSDGEIVLAVDTIDSGDYTKLAKGKTSKITVQVENVYTNGVYQATLALTEDHADGDRQLFKIRNIASFSVSGIRKNANSLVHPHVKITQD